MNTIFLESFAILVQIAEPMTKQNTETEKEMHFYLYSTGIPEHQR